MEGLYGVVISNQKRVLCIKGIFTDYYDAVRWLRKYIADKLNNCMYLGVGNTHMQVDWHSSDSDILESADIDFGEDVLTENDLPVIEKILTMRVLFQLLICRNKSTMILTLRRWKVLTSTWLRV